MIGLGSLENIEKAKRDAQIYEPDCYEHEIFDANLLYEGFLSSRKGSAWKPTVQQFRLLFLPQLSKLQKELYTRTYKLRPPSEFLLNERGKTRPISGQDIRDRTVQHVLCDNFITPAIQKHLIHSNYASQKGKGVDLARAEIIEGLASFYREFGTNDGWVGIMDFSGYYDNIHHDKAKELIKKYMPNENAQWLLDVCVDAQMIDLSFMPDELFYKAMNGKFDSIKYREYVRKYNPTRDGSKMLEKHFDLGNQVSQSVGISYRIPIDNYAKIVKSMKRYYGYMDDTLVIHQDRAAIEDLFKGIEEICNDLGIIVNRKKTRICRLSEMWEFLKVNYSLTETGKVIHKIDKDKLHNMRRRMKKVCNKLNKTDYTNWFNSWFNTQVKYMSKQQRDNILALFEEKLVQCRD